MPDRLRASAPALSVDLSESGGDWSALGDDAAGVYEAAEAVARFPGLLSSDASVSIALASDDEVAALNAAYRGKAAPTNVLSFPAGRGAPTGFLGDVALAAETVAREAGEQGVSVVHHVQHLVVHGLLHLIGYDHQSDAEAERMEALETSILAGLGVADPYAGDPVPRAANVKE